MIDTWRARSACAGQTELLFPSGTRPDWGPARALCASCPVQTECLDAAVRGRETYGMWGGTTPEERLQLLVGEVPPCAGCGAPIVGRDERARYCSRTCAHNAGARRLRRERRGQHQTPDKPTPHGTITGYTGHRCRCPDCKAAKRTYTASVRAKKSMQQKEDAS